MAGKILRVRPICRWHAGEGIEAVVPDGLTWRISTGPIGEGRGWTVRSGVAV
jgi:hypothetical protein